MNPVVVLPSAAREGLASGFAASLTARHGPVLHQPRAVCSLPDDCRPGQASLGTAVAGSSGSAMPPASGSGRATSTASSAGQAHPAGRGGAQGEAAWAVGARASSRSTSRAFAEGLPAIAEECFGPSSIVVTYGDAAELPSVLERRGGLAPRPPSTPPTSTRRVPSPRRWRAGRAG
ncbi:hypothetical protein [Nonomuraea dietziae]|uniref:hypothetical protein n=1 Tax=Nonomuraea dietziae TaxID=65515 RepID=UPI0031DDBFD8